MPIIKLIPVFFFIILSAFALATPARAENYHAEGILKSKNVLSGADVSAIADFRVTAAIPASTTVGVMFSQDRTVFYSATGTKGAWSPCTDGTSVIDISGLGWTGGLLFYKLRLETASSTVTPVVTEVKVTYTGTAVPAPPASDYYGWGTLLSDNLLSGAEVSAITGFTATSSLPLGTAAKISFSQNKIDFYNSSGTKGAWDSLTDGAKAIDLSGLGWSGGSLYYKIRLEALIDPAATPVIEEARAVYTGSEVPPLSGTEYERYGSLVSADLLTGSSIMSGYQYFGYEISYLPYGASVQAQFSRDAISWYSANGTLSGADTLSLGDHTSPTSALSLAGLQWQNSDKFYYKLKFATGPDNNYSPVVASAGLLSGVAVAGVNPGKNQVTDGLVGYWSFDGPDIDWGSTTAEILDRSGNGNNGNAISLSTKSAAVGQIGQGLRFDGVDDYVAVGDSASLRDIAGTALSLSAWVKVKNGFNNILFAKAQSSSTNGWWISVDNYRRATLYIQKATTDMLVESNFDTLPDYKLGWFYLTVTYPGGDEASDVKIYVNGTEVSSYQAQQDGVGAYMSDSGMEGRIGRSAWTAYADAEMDEVRVYNRALSAVEISELYRLGTAGTEVGSQVKGNTSGLVGHWSFDGPDIDWGSTTAEILDRSGYGNNGNAISLNTKSAIIGQIGQGLKFDGVDDYVEIRDNDSIDFSTNQDFAISAWIKVPAIPLENENDIIEKWNGSGGYPYVIRMPYRYCGLVCAHHIVAGRWDNVINNPAIYSKETYNDNQWHNIMFFKDGSVLNLFIDGALNGTTTDTTVGVTTNVSPLYFGNRGGESKYFIGILDNVYIYNRALSADEVSELYRLGNRQLQINPNR